MLKDNHELTIVNIFMLASNDINAYNILAICSFGLYSRPIYGTLCMREYVDTLPHLKALYLVYEELYM